MKRLVLCLVSLALLTELVLVFLNSPQFAIKQVWVKGNKVIPTQQILRQIPYAYGSNIFLIKERRISEIMKRNPIVATAHIHRKLPRTIIVHIFERKPHFVLNTGVALYEVDRSGVPYRIVKAADPNQSMVICAVPGKIVLGRPLKSPGFTFGRECLLLAQAKKISSAAKITVDQTGYICLNVRGKFQVKLGRPEQLSVKLGLVKRVLEQVPEFKQRGMYIDVTCPDAPALKFAE